MTRLRIHLLATLAVMSLLCTERALAQPLGTFSWQQQPYCNRLTFSVTHMSGVFDLAGFDDQCGAAVRAAATGVASVNPNGTVNLGISIITPDVGVVHVDATIALATLSGTWRDHYQSEGTFAFNGSAGGNPRPSPLSRFHRAGGYFGTTTFGGGFYFALGHRGALDAPQALALADMFARFGGGGHNGQAFNWPTGQIDMVAAEDWTPTANGTRIRFSTTPIGETFANVRMLIDADGSVGIGTGDNRPFDRLQVIGDIRVGNGGTTGCLKNSNGGTIVGTCASDVRLKRDLTAFESVLDGVAALRPVRFSWRSDAFPERAFGPAREAGLIAQDVERIFPHLVTTDAAGYKAVDYSQLPLLAVQAIKELKARNAALEARLAALEAWVAGLSGKR